MAQRRMRSNRLVWAGLAGTLVWWADQPTVDGYQPLMQMFWDPGIAQLPVRDYVSIALSWAATTIFCHFVFFTVQRVRARRQTPAG